jgi:SecD/SecF fusion protein
MNSFLATTTITWFEGIASNPLALFCYGLVLLILFGWYFATESEKRKRDVGTVLLVLIVLLCTFSMLPFAKKLKGDITIQGGSSFTMRVQPREDEDGKQVAVTAKDTDNAIKIIEKRISEGGTQEAVIFRQGVNRLVVQMAGITPESAAALRKKLEETAKLELREVHPQSIQLADQVAKGEHIEPGYKAFDHKYKIEEGTPDEKEIVDKILLNRRAAIVGSDIQTAYSDASGIGQVGITLTSEGENKMIAITSPMNEGRDRIAIVLDGVVISAPVVQSKPLGKNFQITGLNAPGEAIRLAQNLMNPLSNALIVDEERTVSPTLGKAVVKQGLISGLVGLLATFLFILVYYRIAGLVALFGLLVNAIMLFGIMAMFGFTFSLAGIAGIVLSIGMAVDANVLIYERLREELASGKSLKNAIMVSYDKAFTAIFDSNFTSLITAVILFWLASGTVKGFALTLTIGLVSSMFSSILVTRVLFRWTIGKDTNKKFTFLNLIKGANYDFLGLSKLAAFISIGLTIASVAAFALKKKDSLGIDFTGGTLITYELGQNPDLPLDQVEASLKKMTLSKSPYAQDEKNVVTGRLLSIRCASEDSKAIVTKITKDFPVLTEKKIIPSTEEVSALLGQEFLVESGIALALGLALIFLYVAFRYKISFAVGALIALFHDCVISCGLIVLTGNQLSLIHVGAILTIAGYSINDTVIIFDRIRETLRYGTGSLKDIMNEAINTTLSRTVLTSGATLFSVAALYLFGGPAMRDFSMMILIGIVVGTYSSIFVASALVLWWSKLTGADYRENKSSDGVVDAEIVQ